MAENTAIEWCDHTFNPWVGCTKVSPACDHCYAEAQDNRWNGGAHWGPHAARRRTRPANWKKPRKWNAEAAKLGIRYRVFCASLADVFDNHRSITSGWHGDLWHLISETPNLDWLLLTKRPQNIMKMLPESYGMPEWGSGWPNVWIGTTAENRTEYQRRAAHLAAVPAMVRFLSCEPLLDDLGDMDLGRVGAANWIIAGGESGPGARPSHPDWFRSVRDQCEAAGVPFFFKQWGNWLPEDQVTGTMLRSENNIRGIHQWPDDSASANVGKKCAGRLLDGVQHDAFPETGGAA